MTNQLDFVRYLVALPGFSLSKTIDRIDNTKGYEPGNLRWATLREQSFNRRNTIRAEYKSETMAFAEFVRRFTDYSVSQAYTLRKQGASLEHLVAAKPKRIGARVRFEERRAAAALCSDG